MKPIRNQMGRRDFLTHAWVVTTAAAVGSSPLRSFVTAAESKREQIFLGVHPYSVKSLFESGAITLESFPAFAKHALGVQAIELAAELSDVLLQQADLAERIRRNADVAGTKVHALLCSDAVKLDAVAKSERQTAVDDHLRWASIAGRLGCAFMRVRASTVGDPVSQLQNAAEGIGRLCDQLPKGSPSLLIENIAGPSRDADWLVDLVKKIGSDRVGVLADFGNFDGDLYAGMAKLMPLTKSICTKSWDFDADGNDTKIDFGKMMQLIHAASFRGCISIEYLGTKTAPVEGVRKTIALVERGFVQ